MVWPKQNLCFDATWQKLGLAWALYDAHQCLKPSMESNHMYSLQTQVTLYTHVSINSLFTALPEMSATFDTIAGLLDLILVALPQAFLPVYQYYTLSWQHMLQCLCLQKVHQCSQLTCPA